MKSLHKTWALTLLLGIAGGATILSAAPDDGAPAATSKKAAPARTLTVVEMATESKGFAEQVRGDLQHVRHLQEVARKQQDIIRLTCVNDKFIAIKAQANVFDDARRNLDGALAATSDERFPFFDDTSAAAENVHKLRVEADTCIGEDELGSESLTEVNDPGLDDPTLGDPFQPVVEPPGYASPFN